MKWRMAPDLDTNSIKQTKFLLFGAGTLGCHVSRCLLGWGARYITFVDNGKVSYSNPVRQSLYNFNDSIDDNSKAILAAKRLKDIFPLVESNGYHLQIPLPGRTLIDQNSEEHFMKSVETIEKLISEHDIIFLLTDSRESRWFPTVISKHFNKNVITAAIGFDSFLVMRHGQIGGVSETLGCYFCNDIISPVDTSNNRTLDQQCTISRPGISSICSGIAAELAMSLVQQFTSVGSFIPHSIRGNLSDYNFACIDHSSFKK
jgi:ubiquitin-like modifier-activating enzyme ATG7